MSEIANVYKELADSMNTSQQRENVTIKDIANVKLCMVNVKRFEDFPSNMQAVYHMLRYLRNVCIQCKKNQDLIVHNGLVGDAKELLEMIFDPTLQSYCDNKDNIDELKLISVQFLGNLVVQNQLAIKQVWLHCFPSLFFSMMSNLDGKGKDYVCMVVYNCLHRNFVLTDNKEECWLLSAIIGHCDSYTEVEWGLLVIELVISSENFKILYEELVDYPDMRASLLDILLGYLADDGSNDVTVPESNLLFLCNQFEAKSSCIMMLVSNMSEELLHECQLIFKILSILSTATGYIERYENLRANEKLLKITVDMLKQICACTQPVVTGTNNNDTENRHPMFDFKRNLVKTIGNMCYRNRRMQDNVRELHGIELILNCCNIDERNPYIMQWAIFAIRTLCEGNLENQQFISGLENHGVASMVMSDTCIDTRVENGKIKISSAPRES